MNKFIQTIFILLVPAIGFAQTYKEKRGIAFSFAVPSAHNFSYYDYELQKQKGRGAVGAGVFLTYKNKKNKISIGAGGFFSSDNAFNFIAEHVGSDSGTETKFFGEYVDALFQRNIFKGLSLVAGISYVDYHYLLRNFSNISKDIRKDDKTLGPAFGVDYTLWGRFGMMILYRPGLISFNNDQNWYTLSFQLHYDIFRQF